MTLLKRAGLFTNDTQGARIFRAATVDDLLAAYRLTHKVFCERGYIRPHPSGLRMRPFEALCETATFIARAAGRVVGVTTVVVDDEDFGLPSDAAFGPELGALRVGGRRVCEGTNWVVADSHRGSAVMTELMRAAFAHAMAAGCTDFVGTVSPGHARFYELLGFETISEVSSYSSEIDDPVVVVRLDLAGLEERFRGVTAGYGDVESFLKAYYIEDNPYERYVGTWGILSERLFAECENLRRLFVEESDFLSRCDGRTREVLRRRWGENLFEQVYAPRTAIAAW